MEINAYAPGTPCWIDLGANDIDKAAVFYGGLFGWDVGASIPEAGGYRIASLRDRAVAGLGPQMNAGPPSWATYVCSTDTAATLDKVRAAGGTVVMDTMEVMGQGVMGVFLDDQGAACSVWQPLEHKGSGLANEHGSFIWNELSARDAEAAMAFYPAVFDWQADVKDSPEMPYTEWLSGGKSIAGMMPMSPGMPDGMPASWSVYFAVDDCDASVARVGELGGSTVFEPMDISIGRFALVKDDQNAVFGVMTPNG